MEVLELVKYDLGIRSDTRDSYLLALIEATKNQVEKVHGLKLDPNDANHTLFLASYSAWRYKTRNEDNGMPRWLQWQLHNLVITNKAGG